MKEEKVILYNDPDNVKWVTNVGGWVDRFGRFWGTDEHMARWSSSTHKQCTCGEIYPKNSYCQSCFERKEIEKYNAMPKRVWEEDGGVYSITEDKWFWSWEEVDDYCELDNCTIESLRLVIGEPVYPRLIDDSYWDDELPEDISIDDRDHTLSALISAVNQYIIDQKPILSWLPGEYAVEVE